MTEILKGKECSLEESKARFEAFFSKMDIVIEVVSWLNPIADIWSVHIRVATLPKLFSNGKGCSKEAALVSAYGELIERLVTQYYFADFYWNTNVNIIKEFSWFHHPQEVWTAVDNEYPFSILSRSLERFYRQDGDVEFSMLLDRNMGHRGVCSIPFVREKDKKQVFIPQNIIANLYVSNGMSCGNSAREAKIQALSEIIERSIKAKIIREEITLPVIPLEHLQRYPSLLKVVEELQNKGFCILVKDASLGGKFPVVNVTLINQQEGGVYCAFGSHPLFDVALERTLTELLQGRALDSLNSFETPSLDMMRVASDENIEDHFIDSAGIVSWSFFTNDADYPFVPWGGAELSLDEQWKFLVNLLHQEQYEIYIADYSFYGEQVYRIIVPGLSEIYPLDDLFLNNSSSFLPIYSLLFNFLELSIDDYYEILRLLDSLALSSMEKLGECFGLIFSNEFWQVMTIGQFKILVYIALGKLDLAFEEFFLQHNLSLLWKAIFSYLDIVKHSSVVNLKDAFITIFGEQLFLEVRSLIDDKDFAILPQISLDEHEHYIKVLSSMHKKAFQ